MKTSFPHCLPISTIPAPLTAMAMATVLLLIGCGGGGSSGTSTDTNTSAGPLTLSGVVAARTAASSRSIDVKCTSGNGTATSNTDGSYTVTVTDGQLPCVLKATNTADGDLYSVAYGSGRTATTNLTPLTQLTVAALAGQDPAAFYTGFGADQAALVSAARVDAAVTTVKTELSTHGIDTTSVGNPVTATLVPTGTTQLANTYGQVLAGLNANLSSAGTSLAQVVTASASLGASARLPADLLSRPQASNCAALRSGTMRTVYFAPSTTQVTSTSDLETVGRGTIDATTLTWTAENGTVTKLIANGNCRYTSSATADGQPLDAVVSPGGMMVITTKINAVTRTGLAFPEQSLSLAELAGQYNMISVETGSSQASTGSAITFTLSATGTLDTAMCQPSELLSSVCTTLAGPYPKLSSHAAGGFSMTSANTADPWTDRWFAYRTGSGDLTLVSVTPSGSYGFMTAKATRMLPALGSTSRSWDLSMDLANVTSATTFGESSFITKSVDSATNSYVRTRRNPLLATDDSHDESIQQNWPRPGYAHRPVGSSTTPSGTTVNYREWISMRLMGTNVSVTYSVPTATQAGVMSLSILQ